MFSSVLSANWAQDVWLIEKSGASDEALENADMEVLSLHGLLPEEEDRFGQLGRAEVKLTQLFSF